MIGKLFKPGQWTVILEDDGRWTSENNIDLADDLNLAHPPEDFTVADGDWPATLFAKLAEQFDAEFELSPDATGDEDDPIRVH